MRAGGPGLDSAFDIDVEPRHPSDAEGPRRNPRPLAAAAAAAGPAGDRRMPVHHGRRRLLRVGRRRTSTSTFKPTLPQSTLGLGQFGAPIFSSGTSSTSTSGTSTSGTSSTPAPARLEHRAPRARAAQAAPRARVRRARAARPARRRWDSRPSSRSPSRSTWSTRGSGPARERSSVWISPTTFSQDLNVPFRQGSFDIGIPQFGGFNPDAGMTDRVCHLERYRDVLLHPCRPGRHPNERHVCSQGDAV